MVTLDQLQEAKEQGGLQGFLMPIDSGLPDWPRVDLDSAQHGKFKHGNHFPLLADTFEADKVRVYGPEGNLLGLGEVSAEGILQPVRVFNL